MPAFRRLRKNAKIAKNSLTNKDEVKHFSVQKLHTETFFLYLHLLYAFYGISLILIGR